jgi:hypothetical protein
MPNANAQMSNEGDPAMDQPLLTCYGTSMQRVERGLAALQNGQNLIITFADTHGIPVLTIADLLDYRRASMREAG